MGNYFDREREIARASKEFNKKLDILEAQCRKDLEIFFDETIYEDGDLMKTAAWYNFKHSIVVEAALSFNYAAAIDERIRNFKTEFSLTESIILGEDNSASQRVAALSNTLEKVCAIRNDVENGNLKEAVMGIRNILPIYCLFENDAAEKVEAALEKAKEEAEEAKAKEEEIAKEESKKDEEEISDTDVDEEDIPDDKDTEEEDSDTEDDKDSDEEESSEEKEDKE